MTAATNKRNSKASLQALQDEVNEPAGGPLNIELVVGVTVRILPPKMWRLSALTAMQEGDFLGWAKKALASTEDYATFIDVDPTLEQIEAFMTRVREVSQEGNAPTSSSSFARSALTTKN